MTAVLRKLKSFFGDGNSDENQPVTHTHWFAESGIVDLFFMLGPGPKDVQQQYAALTGVCSCAA